MTRSALFLLALLLVAQPRSARAQRSDPPPHPVLDDAFVTVTSNAAPCGTASARCADRVIVALGDLDVRSNGTIRSIERGQVAVFLPGESYEIPGAARYYEVALKPNRPLQRSERTSAPPSAAVLYRGSSVMVWLIEGGPGAQVQREPISHRVVIGLGAPGADSSGTVTGDIVIELRP